MSQTGAQTQAEPPTIKVGDLVYIRARVEARVVDVHRLEYLREGLEPGERVVEVPSYYITTVDRDGRVTQGSDFLAVHKDHMVTADQIRRASRGEA
jgi:hypothetical protein